MPLDTLASRPDIYASLEAYWLSAREFESLVTPVFDTLAPTLSKGDRQKALQIFMTDITESAKKLQIFRERRHFYMDSEGDLTRQFGSDEKAKNVFLLRELVQNNIESSLKPSLALLNRSMQPRIQAGKYLYDAELLPPFRREVQALDLSYGLDIWKQIERLQAEGRNIGDQAVRIEIYRSIIEKLNPKGKPWMLQMLKNGNWKNMASTRGFTDVHIGAPNDPNSDVADIIKSYEKEISHFTSQNGELYKNRIEFEKQSTLPTETRFFQDLIPNPQIPSYIHGVMNSIHYLIFNLVWWQDIEDSLAGITKEWKNIAWLDRITNLWKWVLTALGWSQMVPRSLQFDIFWRSAEALMKAASAWEKVQILALLGKIFWIKHPIVQKLSLI